MAFGGIGGPATGRGGVRRSKHRSAIRTIVHGLVAAILLGGLSVIATPAAAAPTEATGSTATADPDSSRPIYRFWSEGYGNSHFYTIDHATAQNVHSTDGWWTYEGTDFRVWPVTSNGCPAGTAPVFRFWSSRFASHFYTMNSDEADDVRRNDADWDYEGVRFCALSKRTDDAVAVHRFWSPRFTKHFYTANAAEAQDLRANDRNWNYEGVAMYAPTSGAAAPPITGDPAPRVGCQSPKMAAAIADHDAEKIAHLFGGAGVMRGAIADGRADCVPLDDPKLPWVVVNKHNAVSPRNYAPSSLTVPSSSLVGGGLRSDVVGSFERMQRDVEEAGAGRIALTSGYRSYGTQTAIHRDQVDRLGVEEGERLAARPGHSEHQLGFAADVVACGGGGCGSIYSFPGSAQERWVRENSWRYGWIVRYESGQTDTTGFNPEAWHLRYIGTDLARIYHDGGYYSLEAFFGLPAAPDYR